MCHSDQTCLQLRQYLTTMEPTDPPFSEGGGRKMMETLFLSNWQYEKNGDRLANPARYTNGANADQLDASKGAMEKKRQEYRRGVPSYKRRRQRAGAPMQMSRKDTIKENTMKELSAFASDDTSLEDAQVQWAINEYVRLIYSADLQEPSAPRQWGGVWGSLVGPSLSGKRNRQPTCPRWCP